MILPDLTFDNSKLLAAIGFFATTSKKDAPEMLRYVGKNFVRKIIDLTPPSRGEANMEAKKLGERAVLRDVDQIFEALDPNVWTAWFDDEGKLRMVPTVKENKRGATTTDYVHFLQRGEMFAFHQSQRTRSNGGVKRVQHDNLIGRKKADFNSTAFVTKADLKWYNREAVKTVGKLAAGWNKAATEFGYRPPEWIARHGSRHGQVTLLLSNEEIMLVLTNDVPFAGRVKGIGRSVQTAAEWQARDLVRQAENYLERTGKLAGFA